MRKVCSSCWKRCMGSGKMVDDLLLLIVPVASACIVLILVVGEDEGNDRLGANEDMIPVTANKKWHS
eukprot:scaffold9354_cov192-Ochromonas_danica.AAC.5